MADAIELLEQQHQAIDELFQRVSRGAREEESAAELFKELADIISVHATIEENVFYPAVKCHDASGPFPRGKEHLVIKRLIAEMLELKPDDERFRSRLTVLENQMDLHITEERLELFPRVRQMFDPEKLELISEEMEQMMSELKQSEPRYRVCYEAAISAAM